MTIHELLRYKNFCTQYDTYRMTHIAYRTILTTINMTRDTIFYTFSDLKYYNWY